MLIETEVPELDEDILYEACPDCFHRDPISEGLCVRCWDSQLIPHEGCCRGDAE